MEHDSSGVTALMVAFSVLSLVSVLVLRDVEATGHPAKDER